MLQSPCDLLGCPSLLGLSSNLWNFQTRKFHYASSAKAVRSTQPSNINISAFIHIVTLFVESCQTAWGCKAKKWGCPLLQCKRPKAAIALHGNSISELRDVTCHMGSHSVTCHPTQVNAPRLTPAMQAGTRFTYPWGMEGWVDLVDLIAPWPGFDHESNAEPLHYQDNRYCF